MNEDYQSNISFVEGDSVDLLPDSSTVEPVPEVENSSQLETETEHAADNSEMILKSLDSIIENQSSFTRSFEGIQTTSQEQTDLLTEIRDNLDLNYKLLDEVKSILEADHVSPLTETTVEESSSTYQADVLQRLDASIQLNTMLFGTILIIFGLMFMRWLHSLVTKNLFSHM